MIPRKKIKICLLQRKVKWTLTWQGWLTILVSFVATGIFIVSQIQPFLAANLPIKADVLVVEGWLPDYALQQAINEFKSGSYQQLITTGGALPTGFYLTEHKTYATLAAATLQEIGIEKEKIVAVTAPSVIKDRTYASAVALKQWLTASEKSIATINVFTLDVHARRSWLLFRQVLEPEVSVGVIATDNLDFDQDRWWRSSAGVRTVICEAIAYIYARFLNAA